MLQNTLPFTKHPYHKFINTVLYYLKYSFHKVAIEAYHSLEMQASLKIKVICTYSEPALQKSHALQANKHPPQATSIKKTTYPRFSNDAPSHHTNSHLRKALKPRTA